MNRPQYAKPQTSFYNDTRTEVNQYLKQNPKGKALIYIKALLLVVLFGTGVAAMWLTTNTAFYILLAITLGTLTLPIVLNIGHEAVHKTFSPNKRINNAAKLVFQLLGTSAYFWELRHISSHHVYSNVSDWDMDIEQSSVIRLADQQEYKSRHKYQHLYMPLVFCFYTLIWFFFRDFKDIKTKQFGIKSIERHPTIEILKIFLAKAFHIQLFITLSDHHDDPLKVSIRSISSGDIKCFAAHRPQQRQETGKDS